MFPKITKPKKVIYLDHAATTPLDIRVKKAMDVFWSEKFGNPSSLYQKGREAKLAIEDSRSNIAKLINARPQEIIFTAGGTESVNLAIFGIARNNSISKKAHFITSVIEHHCVLNSFKQLSAQGFDISFIRVDKQGMVKLEELKKAVTSETVFISIILANNEIGTIEPVAEIGKWLKGLNKQRAEQNLPKIIFHTDACQAAGFLNLDVEKLGVDLMSVNGSKMYGPKQTGFLYVKNGIKLDPIIYGGGQELGLRNGTENVPGIVGLGKAFQLVQANLVKENKRLILLRDYFIKNITKSTPKVLLNGVGSSLLKDSNSLKGLPNNINITIEGVEGEALMLYLDSYGICVSTASACSTGSTEASHVLLAIGKTEKEAKSSIRLTLGKQTNKNELNYVLKVLPQIIKELRRIK